MSERRDRLRFAAYLALAVAVGTALLSLWFSMLARGRWPWE
jgi:hypothetical protein